jgi:hypothetical protein
MKTMNVMLNKESFTEKTYQEYLDTLSYLNTGNEHDDGISVYDAAFLEEEYGA